MTRRRRALTAVTASGRPDLDRVFAHLRFGEQRPATIPMADVPGFTQLAERADPEWLHDLINEVFVELVECLLAPGAHIDKYVGGEIMALFPVPVSPRSTP
jgi:class 3 adenylate cyclase